MAQGYAFFISHPRTVDDLIQPHPIKAEKQYKIMKEIQLTKTDYDNFITDMLADRQFLEENANLCSKNGPVIRCLLIRTKKQNHGVLVVPDYAWVDIAALCPDPCRNDHEERLDSRSPG